jgi:hypothetical protein
MRLQILFVCISTALSACNSKPKVQQFSNCIIKYDSLFKIIDSSNLEINRNTDSAAIEVLDRKTPYGERGLLRFDEKGCLRTYFFLKNDNNDASFFLKYDSIGNHHRSSNSEVVYWYFYKTKGTTIKFTFLLCAFDRNYGDIKIESGLFKKENVPLFQSNFTKLICATISINRTDIDSAGKIYISGKRQDKCSNIEETFVDSAKVPYDQLDKSVQR